MADDSIFNLSLGLTSPASSNALETARNRGASETPAPMPGSDVPSAIAPPAAEAKPLNRLQAVGKLMLSVAAGMGDANSTALLKNLQASEASRAEAQNKAVANAIDGFGKMSEAISRGATMLGALPEEHRMAAATRLDETLMKGANFFRTFTSGTNPEKLRSVTSAMGPFGDFFVRASGGSSEVAQKMISDFVKDENAMKFLREANKTANIGAALEKIQILTKVIQNDPETAKAFQAEGPMTISSLIQMNEQLPPGL